MKKILLVMGFVMGFEVHAQDTFTIKISEKGILENINQNVSVNGIKFCCINLTKSTKPISTNNDFPSVFLESTSNVVFDIKLPKTQSSISDRLEHFNTNLGANTNFNSNEKFMFDLIVNGAEKLNLQDGLITFLFMDKSKIYEKRGYGDANFPFSVSSNPYFTILNKKNLVISTVLNSIEDVTIFKVKRELYDNQVVINHLKYLKSVGKSYNKDWEQYRPVLDEIAQKYETWGKEIDKGDFFSNSRFNLKTVQYLDSLSSYRKSLEILFDKVIEDNNRWIKGWLWFTEGKIKLNPFDVTNPSPQMLIVDEQIQLAEDKIKLLNTYVQSKTGNENYVELEKDLERLSAGLVSLKHQKEDLVSLKAKYDIWINSIKQTSVILYEGKLPVSNNNKIQWLEHYDANNKFIYKNATNTLPHSIADRDEVITLVHNVKQVQEVSITSTEKTVPLEPPIAIELEPFLDSFAKAFQLIPNVGKLANILKPLLGKSNGAQVSSNMLDGSESFQKTFSTIGKIGNSSANYKVFDDFKASTVTYDIILKIAESGNIKQADSLLRIKKGNKELSYDRIVCIGSDFTNKSKLKTIFDSKFLIRDRDSSQNIQAIIIDSIIAKKDRYEYFLLTSNILHCKNEKDYDDVIKFDFKESKEKLTWLLNQTSPITEIKANDNPLTLYRTEILYPEKELKLTTTKEIISQLSVVGNDKPIFSKTYKKYERQRFWPMGGIAIIPGLREIAIYDNDKKVFTNNPISTVEGFVGVKWFVFGKTNIDYKYQSTQLNRLGHGFNRKRGNSITNRLSLNLGLGVSHQFMKNYLVGISIDPTPGIGFNVGVNYYLQKGYELKNGNIENEFERFSKPFIYYGVSIDPTIFNKLFKLF